MAMKKSDKKKFKPKYGKIITERYIIMKKKRQEEFKPKYCKITTERYIITVLYYSSKWQSVTVYKTDGAYKFHGTFAIDINEELKPYSFYTDNEGTEEEILKITSFTDFVYRIVYDAMRWLEFWEDVKYEDEEQEEIARFWNKRISSITTTK